MTGKQIRILIFIVVAQFMCTSLWFAGNAIIPQLSDDLSLSSSDIGWMTSSVQLGFIVGTIIYAFFTIADRFNASNVFLISAMLGGLSNALITLPNLDYFGILAFRFMTGFFLAGIYPVGMKIASDFFEKGLGKALSFLVGALVLGTALPHFIAASGTDLQWQKVLYTTSYLALGGGFLIRFFVGDGPYRTKAQKPDFIMMKDVFKKPEFRAASIGYFGHMWELYTFWAFVPTLIRMNTDHLSPRDMSMESFYVIAIGALACFVGGYLSERFGTKMMARNFLLLSGLCCLISPFVFDLPHWLFLTFMLFWGMVVIADSPLFSTLVAQKADPQLKGTALTLVTSIGFAITIVSIQLLSYLIIHVANERLIFLILILGPITGLYYLRGGVKTASS